MSEHEAAPAEPTADAPPEGQTVGRPLAEWWRGMADIGRAIGYASGWEEQVGVSLDTLNDVVMPRMSEAQALQEAGFHGAAVVSAYTAIEVTLGSVVVRPFVFAGFLTDDLALVFADQILRAPGQKQREMVRKIASVVGVDLDAMRLDDGTRVWTYVTSSLPDLRNRVVHRGGTASKSDADRSIKTAATFIHDLALPLFAALYPEAASVHGTKAYGPGPHAHPLASLMDSFVRSRADGEPEPGGHQEGRHR